MDVYIRAKLEWFKQFRLRYEEKPKNLRKETLTLRENRGLATKLLQHLKYPKQQIS